VNEIRVSREAEAELDEIWLFVARSSGSIDIANRVTDGITARFGLLSRYPAAGRIREDLGPEIRTFVADAYLIVYSLGDANVVTVLHIAGAGRDVFPLVQ